MKLAENIYDLVKTYLNHHGCWHSLRLIDDDLGGQEVRDRCFPPGDLWPKGLRAQGQPGSGEDFLKFHRMMIRNFKWIITTAEAPKYFYASWADFPGWLSEILDAMDPLYRQRLECAINEMVLNASLDELGRFIEGRPDKTTFPDIHSKVHLLVSICEHNVFGPQPSCDMSDPHVALFNEHFWKFHGWIDEIYAQWQTAHGEPVDQSPLKPTEPMDMCPECKHLVESVNPWLEQWQEYLQSRS